MTEETESQVLKVVGGMPTEEVVLSFKAIENFDLTDPLGNIICSYMAGMRYHVRKGNTKLASLAELWQKEGKVIIGG